MERFLSALPDERSRALLRLRYLEGLSIPQLGQALAAQGVFYGRRHLDRLLSEAEKTADALWPDWAEKEVRDARQSH